MTKDYLLDLQTDAKYYIDRLEDINLILTERWKNSTVMDDEGGIYQVNYAKITEEGLFFNVRNIHSMTDVEPFDLNVLYLTCVKKD